MKLIDFVNTIIFFVLVSHTGSQLLLFHVKKIDLTPPA